MYKTIDFFDINGSELYVVLKECICNSTNMSLFGLNEISQNNEKNDNL